jgi:hypothetical protein
VDGAVHHPGGPDEPARWEPRGSRVRCGHGARLDGRLGRQRHHGRSPSIEITKAAFGVSRKVHSQVESISRM